MIDLHTHILPGIDDGSADIGISVEMANIAAGSGTRGLVATPHANQKGRYENYFSEELEDLFRLLEQNIHDAGIPLSLYLGMEIFASPDMGTKIKNGRLISINRSRYYLVEVFFDEEPSNIKKYLDIILDSGGVPLIAHPERYFCVQDNPSLVYDWLKMGCFTQANKGSFFGRFGRDVKEAADILLYNGLISCIASDSHSHRQRTPFLAEAGDYLTENLNGDIAGLLLEENPQRILDDEDIAPHGRYPGRDFYF